MGKFSKNTTHGFFGEARIGIHDLRDIHPSGQRFENERDGNAGTAHARTSSKVLGVSDNPSIHITKLTLGD